MFVRCCVGVCIVYCDEGCVCVVLCLVYVGGDVCENDSELMGSGCGDVCCECVCVGNLFVGWYVGCWYWCGCEF